MDIEQLQKIGEKNNTPYEIKIAVKVFLLAINDWSKPIASLDEYEFLVQKFISSNTTKDNILTALESIDFRKNAWEGESLSQLIEVFDFFEEGLTLKEIIKKIKAQSSI